METKTCSHPPTRQYAWVADAVLGVPELGTVLCVGCCDCKASWVIPNSRKPYENRDQRKDRRRRDQRYSLR